MAGGAWLDWLDELPLEQRLTLPDGAWMLGVHAWPGRDDGPGWEPDHTDEEVMERFAGCDAEVVFIGHTHWSQERRIAGVHVVKVGSVSNPRTADTRAMWMLLDAGYRIERRFAAYDVAAVIEALAVAHHPAKRFVSSFFDGSKQAAG